MIYPKQDEGLHRHKPTCKTIVYWKTAAPKGQEGKLAAFRARDAGAVAGVGYQARYALTAHGMTAVSQHLWIPVDGPADRTFQRRPRVHFRQE